MEEIKESPKRLEPMQSIISFEEVQGKNMNKIYNCLSNRQKKVFDLLCTGRQSVTDITIALGFGDPRSYIRDIRDKGITVNDEWIEKGEVRYKVYWIESEIRSCETMSLGEILDSPAFNNTRYGRR
jgi:hypothetical protein